ITMIAAITPHGRPLHKSHMLTRRASTLGALTQPSEPWVVAARIGCRALRVSNKPIHAAAAAPSEDPSAVGTATAAPASRFSRMKSTPLTAHVAARIAD